MNFKTDRQRDEFTQLVDRDSPMVPVMTMCDEISRQVSGLDAVVTSIWRAPLEQAAICAKLGRKYRSVHEFWRGFDLRSWIYTEAEIMALCLAVNAVFHYRGRYEVLAFHDRGTGPHLHGQIPAGRMWEIRV